MRVRISKLFYSFGIIFLLTGLLLSIVNIPVVAQEEQPEPPVDEGGLLPDSDQEYCCEPNPVPVTVTLKTGGCEQLVFTVSGTKNPPTHGFTLYLSVDDASAPYVASYSPSVTGIDYWGDTWSEDVTVDLTAAWSLAAPGSAVITLQAEAIGWHDEIQEWVQLGYGEGSTTNEECGYTPSPALSLTASCPDYAEGLNVWTLTNTGDGETDYTCIGCSDSGSGYLAAGASETLYGSRTDGMETITVTYGDGQTAGGDNSGMTDAEAMTAGCPDVPTPGLSVAVEAKTSTCSAATFDVTVTNTGSTDLTGVLVNYLAAGAAVNGNTNPLSSPIDLLIGQSQTITVEVPLSWTSVSTSEFVTLTASTMLGDEKISDEDSAYNPGDCPFDLQVVVTALAPLGCYSTQFEVTVTNNGKVTAEGVSLDYTALGAGVAVAGTPAPASTTVGSLELGATSGPYTVNVPVDWNNSNDPNDFIQLTAVVSMGGEVQASHSAKVASPQECYTPDPVVTLEAEDEESCEIYPTEVCIDFTLNISNLPEGAVVTVGEMQFNENGVYIVPVCGEWPGIGIGLERVEISISAAAYLFTPDIAAAAISLIGMGELVAEDTGTVAYIPGETECELPESGLLLQDPFCYATGDGYKAAWQVLNESDFAIDFGWVLNGGDTVAATALPGETVWLGNFALDTANTVVVSWNGQVDELTASLSSVVCQAPTPEPPDTPPGPPVPVTAVEAPAPVAEAGVLIPVTGADLGNLFGLNFFRNLMFYLGLAFMGLAVIVGNFWKK